MLNKVEQQSSQQDEAARNNALLVDVDSIRPLPTGKFVVVRGISATYVWSKVEEPVIVNPGMILEGEYEIEEYQGVSHIFIKSQLGVFYVPSYKLERLID